MKTYLVYTYGFTVSTKEVNNEQHAKNYANKCFKSNCIYIIVQSTEEQIQNEIDKAIASLKRHNLQYRQYYKSLFSRIGRR